MKYSGTLQTGDVEIAFQQITLHAVKTLSHTHSVQKRRFILLLIWRGIKTRHAVSSLYEPRRTEGEKAAPGQHIFTLAPPPPLCFAPHQYAADMRDLTFSHSLTYTHTHTHKSWVSKHCSFVLQRFNLCLLPSHYSPWCLSQSLLNDIIHSGLSEEMRHARLYTCAFEHEHLY